MQRRMDNSSQIRRTCSVYGPYKLAALFYDQIHIPYWMLHAGIVHKMSTGSTEFDPPPANSDIVVPPKANAPTPLLSNYFKHGVPSSIKDSRSEFFYYHRIAYETASIADIDPNHHDEWSNESGTNAIKTLFERYGLTLERRQKDPEGDHEPRKTHFALQIAGSVAVDTSNASWDQILAIRSDPSCTKKLRRFRSLAIKDLSGMNAPQIEDHVLTVIDDYQSALKTWSLDLKLGVIEVACKSSTLPAGAAAIIGAAAGMSIGGPVAAAPTALLAAGAVELAGITVELARRVEQRRELHRKHDYSYIMELRERLRPR